MTIWILAVLVIAGVSLAGWRQGAIRAAFAFVGILFAALLAVPIGHLIHPLLPHLGVSSPVTAWALSPVIGFIIASIPLKVAGHFVHHRADHFYRYKAGDLRQALWERLSARLGICIGLLNGATYFVLVSFFIYNAAYWTTQATKDPADLGDQPLFFRLMSNLGNSMQSSGFTRTAAAVGTLPPAYYKMADLTGTLMQNPQTGPRFAEYPGLTSLWHRDDMQSLVSDGQLTNALNAGSSLSDILNTPSIQGLLANKDQAKMISQTISTNLDDLTSYLQTGKSAKYTDPIIGSWTFNAGVTLAWFRQAQPKLKEKEVVEVRTLWSQAYAKTTFLMTGDNQVILKNFPKFVATPPQGQPPYQAEDWKGDWSRDGANYTVHLLLNGQDKFLVGTSDGLRLKLKDGQTQLVFDHAD